MGNIARLIIILLDMFKGVRQEVVTNEIKDDPLGSFDDKFGRVRDNTDPLQKPDTK